MKKLIKPLLLLLLLNLSLFSCSVQDEVPVDDDSEILATDRTNQDDDPEIDDLNE